MTAKLLDTKTSGRLFVDRYELIGEIASGGMATVYLARLTGVGGFQRLFAIKRLHPHLQGEKEFVEMFLDEARLAAGIHHPHVVPILEVGASDTGYYLVMEYIEGETLARLLTRAAGSKQRIPPAVVIRAGLDMLAGLHAAHELRDESGALAGVVHRDVSPQNVLVGVDGVTRITDFGVARAASRLTATRVGQLKGKIAYMAPEQARGEEDLDRRADVFASGIVLWETLAHKRLFKAESEAATLARVLNEPIPTLQNAAPHLPLPIAQVVMKSLERELSARFQTCAEFADALERAAMASGMLGTGRDMAAFMQQVMGAEIQEQRAAVRTWVARAEADPGIPRTQLTPSVGRTMAAVASETGPELSAATRVTSGFRVSPVALVLVLLLLGVGGFFGYRTLTAAPPVATTATGPVVVDADDRGGPLATGSAAAAPTSAPVTGVTDLNDLDEAPTATKLAPGVTRAPSVGQPGSTAAAASAAAQSPASAGSTTQGTEPVKKKPPKKTVDDALGENPYR